MNENSNKSNWYIKIFFIIIFLYAVFISFIYFKDKYFVGNANKEIDNKSIEKSTKKNIDSDPLNITYNIDNEDIALKDGISLTNIDNSSSKIETRIFGKPVIADINNDGKLDSTFFISQETGGTGIFFYVVSAIDDANGYKGTKAIFLGDRISPQNININNKGIISVNYVIRGDDEPMTVEPSIGITKYLVFKDGELLEIKNN